MSERKSYLLRLPNELLDELNRWAKDELRSLNAQIEFVLREAVRSHRRKDVAPPDAGATDSEPGDEAPAP